MPEKPRLQRHTGPELADLLPELARLRIAVFREFPYLYDGELSYEERYLRTYILAPQSVIVLARDGGRVVGASTATALNAEEMHVQRPFIKGGYDPGTIFYLGESVLLPEYRGRGIGVRFFEEREAHARALGGFQLYAFCAVERPADHPRRPADYRPLDHFWRHRGYQRHPELTTQFRWRDLDETEESPKPMVFWLKRPAATL